MERGAWGIRSSLLACWRLEERSGSLYSPSLKVGGGKNQELKLLRFLPLTSYLRPLTFAR
jgi:hypothetical protein